jgi:4-hydroxy-tetrahydrodipicolinate synthase
VTNADDYLYGCIAPTFTAFHEDGTLDDLGQRNLIDFMLERGSLSALFIRSGMGQMYTFSEEDTRRLTRNVCAHVGGRIPIFVGCSGIWDRNYDKRPDPKAYLEQAVALSRFALEHGAAAVVHTVPEAIAPSEKENPKDVVRRYFETVCDAVDGPVLFYQPPGTLADYQLTPTLLAQIADLPNLIGGKVSHSDAAYLFDLIYAVRGKDFHFIAGNEMAYYAALYAGATAVVGQGCCLNPQILKALQTAFESGDIEETFRAQASVNKLCRLCPNPQDFLKCYATEHGYPVGRTARTMKSNPYATDPTPLTAEQYQAFKAALEQELAAFTS